MFLTNKLKFDHSNQFQVERKGDLSKIEIHKTLRKNILQIYKNLKTKIRLSNINTYTHDQNF